MQERAARRAAEAATSRALAERDAAIAARLAADQRFDASSVALAIAEGAVREATSKSERARAAAARERAGLEQLHAAQLAAVKAGLQEKLDAALGEVVRTRQEMLEELKDAILEETQQQANNGTLSPRKKKGAAHVMSASCSSAGSIASLPSTSDTKGGRSIEYMRVLGAKKSSDQVGPMSAVAAEQAAERAAAASKRRWRSHTGGSPNQF